MRRSSATISDVGRFVLHTFGKFLRSTTDVPWAVGCVDEDLCNDIPDVPAPRPANESP